MVVSEKSRQPPEVVFSISPVSDHKLSGTGVVTVDCTSEMTGTVRTLSMVRVLGSCLVVDVALLY